MVKCRKCGTENKEEAKICKKCGAPMKAPAKRKPAEAREPKPKPTKAERGVPKPKARLCARCGAKLSSDARFCPECGESIKKPKVLPKEREEPPVPREGRGLPSGVKALIAAGALIAIVAVAAIFLYPILQRQPWVTVGYIPAGWYLTDELAHGEVEGEYDPDGAGLIVYTDSVDYDSVLIYYERAPGWTLTPSDLQETAANIFERDLGYAPDETGTMTVVGTTAGYAKGYDSEFDVYDLRIELVLGPIYMDIYACYDPTSEDEAQVMSLIDSISVVEEI